MFLFTALVGTFFTILLMAYFFPYMIALWGGSRNLQFIAVLNLLFGWCVVGWLATLGYLVAFTTATLCVGVVDRFDVATHVAPKY
jgi:hypothetical protein